jgi:hypothetical protein
VPPQHLPALQALQQQLQGYSHKAAAAAAAAAAGSGECGNNRMQPASKPASHQTSQSANITSHTRAAHGPPTGKCHPVYTY